MRLILLCFFVSGLATAQQPDTLCLSPVELELYTALMQYRAQHRLPPVSLSHWLTKTARLHARDVVEERVIKGRCNAHSWSPAGPWTPCCYTDNHKAARCMWDKPREISHGVYAGTGFEIAFTYGTDLAATEIADASLALKGWQQSPGHNSVILNLGSWKQSGWKAIGIGIYRGYACVWFSTEADPLGVDNCPTPYPD
ncbi:MAG: CAP domain-containing protein [Bacteroidetes bacterium]|jgi:hypothetical protein|nr:CAP domain-containing protein [Bacteroidota bacterium]